jgi:hypothetical protein
MKPFTWAVLAAVGVTFAAPAIAADPPVPGSAEELIADQEAEVAAWKAKSTVEVVEVRDGAGSMEPADTKDADADTAEDRAEREFVTSVWNSP